MPLPDPDPTHTIGAQPGGDMARWKFVGAVVVAVGLVAGGCASGDGGGSGEAEGESLQDFIPGVAAFDDSDPEADFRQRERVAQDEIATCMAEQGWEYIPYVRSEDVIFGDAETPEEFAEQYGLMITWDLLNQAPIEDGGVPPEVEDDPNYAIQEALSPEEREAYNAALHGNPPDIDHETMTEEEIEAFYMSWQPDGCYNEAYESVFNSESSMAFYEAFGSDIEAMFERANTDPRITELESSWSECMAEAGYDFQDQMDPEIFILRRLEEVGVIQDLEIDPGGGFGFGSEGISPGTPEYEAAERIFEEEVTIATTSLSCRGDTEQVYQEVFAEYEQEFIEENRAKLEEFRDSTP